MQQINKRARKGHACDLPKAGGPGHLPTLPHLTPHCSRGKLGILLPCQGVASEIMASRNRAAVKMVREGGHGWSRDPLATDLLAQKKMLSGGGGRWGLS